MGTASVDLSDAVAFVRRYKLSSPHAPCETLLVYGNSIYFALYKVFVCAHGELHPLLFVCVCVGGVDENAPHIKYFWQVCISSRVSIAKEGASFLICVQSVVCFNKERAIELSKAKAVPLRLI